MGARARGRCKRLDHLGRGGARVIIDSFNIGLEVFICDSYNFSIEFCKWFAEIDREFTDFI